MNGHICGLGPTLEFPDVGNTDHPCCLGSAEDGPAFCTCWEAIYDLHQQPLVQTLDQTYRDEMCGDCAYRPDSPERQGDERVTGDTEQLEMLVATNQPFTCHQGIRRITGYEHPSGATWAPDGIDAGYQPPIRRDGVAFKADGTPADLCAGWRQRRVLFEASQ